MQGKTALRCLKVAELQSKCEYANTAVYIVLWHMHTALPVNHLPKAYSHGLAFMAA